MLDPILTPIFARVFQPVSSRIVKKGISANKVTLIGLGIALAGCFGIGLQMYIPGLILILIARIFDGLDGMVARVSGETGLGSVLDPFSDFITYGAFAFFFMLSAPEQAMGTAFLIFSYLAMGLAYMGYRLLMVKLGRSDDETNGLVGNSEITIFMALCCLYPPGFSAFALIFGIACFVTAGLRVFKTIKA